MEPAMKHDNDLSTTNSMGNQVYIVSLILLLITMALVA